MRSIEHGHLADEATAAMIAEKGAWWSLQPFLDDEDANPHSDPRSRAKQLMVTAGTDIAYELARKHSIKLAWGTDTLFDAKLGRRQGAQLANWPAGSPRPKPCARPRRATPSCWP